MRGDRPRKRGKKKEEASFTPHARGSTQILACWYLRLCVYPCADHFLLWPASSAPGFLRGDRPHSQGFGWVKEGLPRMRGDRPLCSRLSRYARQFTPHARGSTAYHQAGRRAGRVYPACAGIDLGSDDRNLLQLSLPRMRGDRPYYSYCEHCDALFTPHARGSTRQKP